MAKYKKKWKWKNGRLHHPEEPKIVLSTTDAYNMQDMNDDIAHACEGVLKTYDENRPVIEMRIIDDLRREREDGIAL